MATAAGTGIDALPDPSSTTPPGTVGYSGTLTPGVGAAAVTSLISTDPAPGQIDPDPNVARWVPIEVVFEIPVGTVAMIIVQMGENSGLTLVAYNGNEGGWSSLFSEKSTIEFSGTVVTARVLPNAGWHRSYNVITPGSFQEAD